MHLIKRLEKRARELDEQVRAHGASNYGQDCADERELLLEAAKTIRRTCGHPRMVALDDKCWQCPDCGYIT